MIFDQKKHLNSLILAGGKSSRMGQDKALLNFKNIPLLKQTYNIAEQCSNRVYILTPWPERYCEILPKESQFLLESSGEQGVLVAFYQGFKQIEISTNWLLLLACDLPLLEPETLLNWCQQLDRLPPEVLACIPKNSDRWEPLCGFYRSSILHHLEKHLETHPDRSFQKFLKTIPIREIVLSDREKRMLWNCNTPDDLKQIDSFLSSNNHREF